jgi:2'-5' RNA ligase
VKARLFVAVDLPEEVREALVEWRPRDRALRLVEAEALHVTLCFLGWREEAQAEGIGAAVADCAMGVGEVGLGKAVWLPPRRSRVLAVELEDPAGGLVVLQRSVSEAMVNAAGHVLETRPYLPHVTVARVRRGERAPRAELPEPPRLRFTPSTMTLYRSHLAHTGASYEPLTRAELR